METVAKLFKNGRSQAVRLPKEFRFPGDTVKIKKDGNKVILGPMDKKKWPNGFWEIFSADPDFEPPRPLPSKSVNLDEY